MDLSRRSFLTSIGLGAVSLTLPQNKSLVDSLIRKVGPPPVNVGFARAVFPRGFHMMQFQWSAMSTSGFDFRLFRPNEKSKTTLMQMEAPASFETPAVMTYQLHGSYFVGDDKGETFEFWIRPNNPEEVAPDVKMTVNGFKTGKNVDGGKWEIIDIPIRKVRLDHGWAIKNGIIRPDEPPAITYEEKEEEQDDSQDSDLYDSE
jgi:hypothetical protein